jgi:hypothetical protein
LILSSSSGRALRLSSGGAAAPGKVWLQGCLYLPGQTSRRDSQTRPACLLCLSCDSSLPSPSKMAKVYWTKILVSYEIMLELRGSRFGSMMEDAWCLSRRQAAEPTLTSWTWVRDRFYCESDFARLAMVISPAAATITSLYLHCSFPAQSQCCWLALDPRAAFFPSF